MNYTTRKDFPEILPKIKTFYCWTCRSTDVFKETAADGVVNYICKDCGESTPRVLIYDSNMQQHFDGQDRLVHESCGIFLVNKNRKVLLFKRLKYPYLLTIPAGHLEVGESPSGCAIRETFEEVGVVVNNLELVFCGDIEGDSCLGGADIHHWNAYITRIDDDFKVKLDEEGCGWGWYDTSDLKITNTVRPVLILLSKLEERLDQKTGR